MSRDVLNKTGILKAIASDDDGEFKGGFTYTLDAEGIDRIVMTTHLPCIDRLTRAIRRYVI